MPEKVIISVGQAYWSKFSRIWASWDDNEKTLFREVYGDIFELIKVPIDEVVVRALTECWNTSYRCFPFGKVDMTPTLEVYRALLNILNVRRHSLYTKAIRPKVFTTKMIVLTRKIYEWVEEYIQDEGISWAQMKNLIYEQTSSKRRRDHFTLSIYGLFIPATHGLKEVEFSFSTPGYREQISNIYTTWVLLQRENEALEKRITQLEEGELIYSSAREMTRQENEALKAKIVELEVTAKDTIQRQHEAMKKTMDQARGVARQVYELSEEATALRVFVIPESEEKCRIIELMIGLDKLEDRARFYI
ncbi:hypothetical protein F3Y22_tig00110151pilonHSYRG00264 [Hibiscus syriacus]|uniref:DUF7745 domain-containing protein n=1 Tax=Hibiscus syriacus TaxID=106335 RepID=A0A6A3BLI4_HIBSY|nr:hypothetical protein F3Y22_tig00110151pilonHSYRG00264 [Hibiscus syriacus]